MFISLAGRHARRTRVAPRPRPSPGPRGDGSSVNVSRHTCCATQRSLGNMFARRLCVGHGSLLKFTSTRTAFAPPGPGCLPVPRLLCSYSVHRLPRFPRPRLWSALAFGLPWGGCLFFAAGACIPRTHQALESDNRVSLPPDSSKEKRGPPRLRGRPHVARAVVVHPAGFQAALAHFGRLVVAFE
jgi:hypothetical protein